ncbi:MAG: penicillin acylase family protein, partial [Deltaproteobacteria bacterium]|nr:penicillin acylase family protein [Deltaproteobacteria bacterium]MBW2536818.1 penicillin acylase family protein [Deltaproteobacteria bacterium]
MRYAVLAVLLLLASCGSPQGAVTAPVPDAGAADGSAGEVTERRHPVAGLSAPATIVVDRWGVPHISASSLDDLFFAQGFNAARDRLWQLDLWKRRGEGRLSEALGREYLEQDRAARLFLYRGDMAAEWASYGPDAQRIATAFAAGINAFIELSREHIELRPYEFGLLGYEPLEWTPETVVRIRSHGLARNATSELARAQHVQAFGLESLKLRDRLEPAHDVKVPEGLDLEALRGDVLGVYRLARQSVTLPTSRLAALDGSLGQGSNNWVVSGSRTAAGRPILANDPHRRVTVPSLRYLVHLTAPGLDVIGGGEPALPGISIGHNGQIAFGLTVFWIDQEDLYVYETRPGKPNEYRYRDGWEPMRILEERIAVRGVGPQPVTLKFTRHGPVVFEDAEQRRAVAVRAAWLEPGMAPYFAGLGVMRARSFDEFVAAMRRWGAPPENLIYADATGAIGWKPGGRAPIRPNWDGLLPVPGDGRYEWQGYLDPAKLPVEKDPPRGFIATANQFNLPDRYPHRLGYEWSSPSRFERIREVLAANQRVSMDQMVALQGDYVSLPARRLVELLASLEAKPGAPASRALSLLRGWDGVLHASSGAAALFEIWYRRHLGQRLLQELVADPAERRALDGGDPELCIALLERPDRRLGERPAAMRDRILLESLASAAAETERLLGGDWSRWRWGSLHRAHLKHPVSPLLADQKLKYPYDVGPVARGGSEDTVCKTMWRGSSFLQLSGASFRVVIDVGAWDESRAM